MIGRRARDTASERRAAATGAVATRRFGRREHVRSDDGPDGAESLQALLAEVVLLREENAGLKAAQHQPASVGRALRHVRSLSAAPVDDGELADDAAQMLVESLVLRESLLQVCEEIEEAMARVRSRLNGLGALERPEELAAASRYAGGDSVATEMGRNGHEDA
jgi:hypothetical protein